MPVKILLVDDEPDLESLIKLKFRKQIRENIYNFVYAENGSDALNKLNSNPDTQIILTDINMPQMDGLTLLLKVSEISPLIKSVIITAYNDMQNIRSAMNRGALDFITKPINFEDLNLTIEKAVKIVEQLNQTIQAIKENNILKMYVDPSVINFMTRKEFENKILANESVEATIMFVDICGFTKISEKQSPDFVVNLLNKYLDGIVKEIIANHGYIDKFIGDSVMAIYRGEYHIDRAIEAALNIRSQIKRFRQESLGDEFYAPSVSIGINSGSVISGNIGSASLQRLDFTVIGDTVNTASRLQGAAKDDQIIINEPVYLNIKDSFICEKIGPVNVKNKTDEITIYNVLE